MRRTDVHNLAEEKTMHHATRYWTAESEIPEQKTKQISRSSGQSFQITWESLAVIKLSNGSLD